MQTKAMTSFSAFPSEMHSMWQKPHPDQLRAPMAQETFQLPVPLDEKKLAACLTELNNGTRRAVETCVECFKNNRMSKEDLISFIQSIASQSKTLKSLFTEEKPQGELASASDLAALFAMNHPPKPAAQVASAADMAELFALSGQPPKQQPVNVRNTSAQFGEVAGEEEMAELRALAACGPQRLTAPISKPEPLCAVVHGSNDAPHIGGATRPHLASPIAAPKPKPARVRRAKVTEPTAEEKFLMAWWSDRRVPEVLRRQTESCFTDPNTTAETKRVAYMKYVMTELRNSLPPAGRSALLPLVAGLNSNTMDLDQFASAIANLVDEYGVVIPLIFAPECTVRCPRQRAVVEVEDSMDEDWIMNTDDQLVVPTIDYKEEKEELKEPVKRKRTETLKGSEPKVDGEEDEDARCPVCVGAPQDDDRWVKCDGCSSWYHQICVLFNEQAHGKSVRFFCRTPGCRKRGSRQLNRRQRKPCYPSSPGLEDSNMGRYLSSYAQQYSRQDRNIVVKMVANQSYVREARGGRGGRAKGGEEKVQAKTLLCHQHTVIGSDLLFMVVFVEEVRTSDGSCRVEVTGIDSNGLYEGLEDGERQRVEGGILTGYLQHSAMMGFRTARVTLSDTSGDCHSLFFARPHGQAWGSMNEIVASVQAALGQARASGLVTHLVDDSSRGGEVVMTVGLATNKSTPDAIDSDVEMASSIAGKRSEWQELMSGNNYRFESLQYAKFSSMMLVYHIMKGGKKEMPCASSSSIAPSSQVRSQLTSSSVPASLVKRDDSMSEDEESDEQLMEMHDKKRLRMSPLPLALAPAAQQQHMVCIKVEEHDDRDLCVAPPPPFASAPSPELNCWGAAPSMDSIPAMSARVPALTMDDESSSSSGSSVHEMESGIFGSFDPMLEDVLDPSLMSGLEVGGSTEDPFWDHFLTQLSA